LDIYGKVRKLEGDRELIPFRYQGQYEDVDAGLYYNRFRYYSPEEGVYISQDPQKLKGGLNLQSYVPDPLKAIDPLGLEPIPLDQPGNTVYGIFETGAEKPFYVGITNDFDRRFLEHQDILPGKDLPRFDPTKHEMIPMPGIENNGDLKYAEARGWEQALMEHHGTRPADCKGEFPGNVYNSFSHSREDGRGVRFESEYEKAKNVLK